MGMPEHEARRFFLEMEQVLFAPQFAVVAFLRFFQPPQVLFQRLPVRPGRPVDTLQHFIGRVAAPVSACQLGQFERGQFAGTGHVRAAAQVREVALPVQRQFLIRGNGFDDLRLVLLAEVAKKCNGLVPRHDGAADAEVLLGKLLHLCLDCGQVVRGKRPLKGEIIIEPVFNHGADGDLCFREQFLHRLRQQVRAGMAQYLQAFIVARGNDAQARIGVDQLSGVYQPAVCFAGQGRPRKARTDIGGNIQYGYGLIITALTAVRQGDNWHVVSQTRFTG